jgi:hypothetical protein
MHVCMYVAMYGHIVHTGVDECVYPGRCHARIDGVHVYLSPSIHLNI